MRNPVVSCLRGGNFGSNVVIEMSSRNLWTVFGSQYKLYWIEWTQYFDSLLVVWEVSECHFPGTCCGMWRGNFETCYGKPFKQIRNHDELISMWILKTTCSWSLAVATTKFCFMGSCVSTKNVGVLSSLSGVSWWTYFHKVQDSLFWMFSNVQKHSRKTKDSLSNNSLARVGFMRHGETDSHSYVGISMMVPLESYLFCRLQRNEFHGRL